MSQPISVQDNVKKSETGTSAPLKVSRVKIIDVLIIRELIFLHRNRVNIFPKCSFLNYFLYLCTQKRASLLTLGN